MFYSILNLKLKQLVGSFKAGAILKFLAPDLLVGLFLALSTESRVTGDFAPRLGEVAVGIALFTSIVETRKLFFTGGDLEDFYFVQPTTVSRFASFSTVFILNFMIVLSVVLPSILLLPLTPEILVTSISVSVLAVLLSTMLYFVVVSSIALLPGNVAHSSLTVVQILMALVLLASFQLSSSLSFLSLAPSFPFLISFLILLISLALFLLFPFQEKLVSKLKANEPHSHIDLSSIVERLGKFLFMKSEEEDAGFLLLSSNIFRNQSLRLATIGIAATPVMVAIYWTLLGFRFISFDPHRIFFSTVTGAPIVSLVTSGVVVQYFLSQNLLSSKDCDAAWLFKVIPRFSTGKFVLGFRKSFLAIVHVPTTLAVFLVVLCRDTLFGSVATALTFYVLVHVAISFFSIMQRKFPFTLPFTQIVSQSAADLIFFLAYSVLVAIVLFMSYGKLEYFLMLNLFALVLVGSLEFVSSRIIDRRMKLDV